jgi:drug/metabolite transporter (DMT)-like permease
VAALRTTSRENLGTIAATAAIVSWGFGPIFIKLTDLPARPLALYRMWLGFAVMLTAQLVLERRLTVRAFRRSALGGVLFGMNMLTFFSAVKETSVADVSLITALQPALVLVVAGRWFGERVGRREISLTAVALAGVSLVIVGSAGSPEWSAWGDVLGVGALVTFTGYFLASKSARGDLGALEYMTAVMGWAGLVITPVIVLSTDLPAPSSHDWLILAGFVIIPGAGGHLLMNWAHGYVDVSVSSVMVVAAPVLSALLAVPFLDESFGPLHLAGSALVVGAIIALVRSPGHVPAIDPDTSVETAAT